MPKLQAMGNMQPLFSHAVLFIKAESRMYAVGVQHLLRKQGLLEIRSNKQNRATKGLMVKT
jgi:hypothetical protein